MYIVDKYQTAQYKDSLHKMGPTVYLVPEKMTHWQYDENIKDYVKGTGTVGRNTCGGLIHDVRAKFKNYLISLSNNDTGLYEMEMTQHKNLPGFYDPKYNNYNAKRMVEDDKFIPKLGQLWYKKFWPSDTWAPKSPQPKYKEPYWHTTHSITKSNNWVLEHMTHMYDKVQQGILTADEYLILHKHLDDCVIEMPVQQTHKDVLQSLTI